MRSKKAVFGLEKTAEIIILLVLLAVVYLAFFAPKGALEKVAEKAEIFRTFIPIKEPLKPKPEAVVSEELLTSFDSLFEALIQGEKSPNTNCIIYFKEIPELDEWRLKFLRSENGMAIRIINPEGQAIKPLAIPNLKPCIVAGKEGERIAAKNFYHNHINPKTKLTGDNKEYTEYEGMETGEWTIGNSEFLLINKKYYNLYDINLEYKGELISLLYKADKTHICFMPTIRGWLKNYGEDGIDNDLLKKFLPGGEHQIPLCYQN